MARRNPISTALLLLAVTTLTAGCSPLLPLIGAALGGPGEKSQLAGTFAGAPSATQNRRPAESPVPDALADALAGADQTVRQSCVAKLPPPVPAPETGCAMRMTCLPGSELPIRLRLCASDPHAVLSELARPAVTDWRWADDSKVATP
jgi:hypothetical protein